MSEFADFRHSRTTGVILAGGFGTRMRPVTLYRPKPLITVAGKPFVEMLIERLVSYGVANIILLVSYGADMIQDVVGDGRQFGAAVNYSVESEPTGTARAVARALPALPARFVLQNGDDYPTCNISSLWRYALSFGGESVVAGTRSNSGQIHARKDNLVTSWGARGTGAYEDVGTKVLMRDSVPALQEIPIGATVEEEVFPVLIQSGGLRLYPSSPSFSVGSPGQHSAFVRSVLSARC